MSLPKNTLENPEMEHLRAPESSQNEANEEKEPLNDVVPEDTEVVVPPDGGWGWMVVFASFMCNLIVDGIIFSFGSFLEPISIEFGVTKAYVALVGSLMSGFYLIAGPFASAVANRYGFRLVAIGGSVLAAVAFVLANFATNVEYLCVVFGVLGGIGFGFVYVPSIITLGFYFEKWRALATGIGVCGSGIGTFLFAPLTTALIENLGWRSALLCQGAIVFASFIFGLLYRPLKPTKVKEIKEKEEGTELIINPRKLAPLSRMKMEMTLEDMNHEPCHASQGSLNRVLGANSSSNYPRVANVYNSTTIPLQKVDLNSEKRLSVPFFTSEDKLKDSEGKECLLNKSLNALIIPKSEERDASEEQEINRPMYRDDIFFSASLTRLPQYTSRTSISYNISVTKLPTKNDIEEEKKQSCTICPEAVKRTLATMLDYSLLKSPTFLLLAFGGFFTMMGFYVPFMYLVNRAKEAGMKEEYWGFLISAIGIANTVGRVLCGILSSFPGVNALFVTNAALTIGGIATIFSGFSMSAEYQFIYAAIFGLSISTFACLRSIVVVDLLGLEKLTNAFGLILLFQGVAAIFGAPLAGAFNEAVGNYDASFYFSGGLLLGSAIMCYPLNYINRIEMTKRNKLENKSVPV